MPTWPRDLLINLAGGARLLLFLRVSPERFRATGDQLVFLSLLTVALDVFWQWFFAKEPVLFDVFGLYPAGFVFCNLFLAAYLVTRLGACPHRFPLLLVSSFSYSFWFSPMAASREIFKQWMETLASLAPDVPGLAGYLGMAWAAWVIALNFRVVKLTIAGSRLKYVSFFILFTLLIQVPQTYLLPEGPIFWEVDWEQDRPTSSRSLDREAVLFFQSNMVEDAAHALLPQRPGKSDLYYLGFASHARQGVFLKEIRFAHALFDNRFGTKGRSLTLVNHFSTYQKEPLATGTNLGLALRRIGERMDVDEDVLILYFTSHGSPDFQLDVSFGGLPLNDLSALELRDRLDEAGIKWRIILVSACYSGGFVPILQDPHTLIATAAASDRTSFGCGDEFDFTYFGEAMLKEGLGNTYSFTAAFDLARKHIVQKEQAQKITPSYPQLFVGSAMAQKLVEVEEALLAEETATGRTPPQEGPPSPP